MAKKADRVLVTLACTTCKSRTYLTEKNKRNDAERMDLSKYCPKCKSHTAHREAK